MVFVQVITISLDLIKQRLTNHVKQIAIPRTHYLNEENIEKTLSYLSGKMNKLGYLVNRHEFYNGQKKATNLECWSSNDDPSDITIFLTAHHDAYPGSPGADDNASSLAVLLEVARVLASKKVNNGIGYLFFDLEEVSIEMIKILLVSAYFDLTIEKTEDENTKKEIMLKKEHYLDKKRYLFGTLTLEGSRQWITERFNLFSNLKAIINLESVGYCSKEKNSQQLIPHSSYVPPVGDFLGLVYTEEFRWLFSRMFTPLSSTGLNLVPIRVDLDHMDFGSRSDHAAFWNIGFPALMLTDTFEYRNPHYHKNSDVPETLDYGFMAAQVKWLSNILPDLVRHLKNIKVW